MRERSIVVAIFRRVVGFVPYLGDFADWLPIPYDFEFRRDEEVIAAHRRRRWKWRDVYDLDLTGDVPAARLDRRLVMRPPSGWTRCKAAGSRP